MSQIQTLQPAESRLYDFQFENLLGPGETIAAVVGVTQQLVDTSTTPTTLKATTDLILGVPTFSGTLGQVRVSSCVKDRRYKLEMDITTSESNILQHEGLINCKDL